MFSRKDWLGNVKHKDSFGSSDHEMLNFKTFRAVRGVHSKPILEFRRASLSSSGICLVHRKSLGEQRSPRKLVDIQGSPLQGSEVMPLSKGEFSKNVMRPAWLRLELLENTSRRRKPREDGSRDR